MYIFYTTFRHSFHHCWGICRSGAPVFVSLHRRMMPPWRSDREICGKCRESVEMANRLSSWIFYSTARTKSSLTADGRPLRGSSCTFSRPSLKSLTHLLTVQSSWYVLHTSHKVDDECQPVSCFLHSRNELQTAFHMRRASRFSWIF
jgi:hypothetical protein